MVNLLQRMIQIIVVYMVIAEELIGRHDPAYRNSPTYAFNFGENHDY